MSLYTSKGVEVEVLDQGFVLTWRNEDPRFYYEKTRGKEIFADKSALMKRLKELL